MKAKVCSIKCISNIFELTLESDLRTGFVRKFSAALGYCILYRYILQPLFYPLRVDQNRTLRFSGCSTLMSSSGEKKRFDAFYVLNL